MENPLRAVGVCDDADREKSEGRHEGSPEERAVEVAEERGPKDDGGKVEDKDAGDVPGAHARNNAEDLTEAAALGLRLALFLLGTVKDDRARENAGMEELGNTRDNGHAQKELQRPLFREAVEHHVHGHSGTKHPACQCGRKNTVSLHVRAEEKHTSERGRMPSVKKHKSEKKRKEKRGRRKK